MNYLAVSIEKCHSKEEKIAAVAAGVCVNMPTVFFSEKNKII